MTDLLGNGAVFSDCGRYRLRLDRYVGAGDTVAVVVGVNPSTAGADVDDQTTKKWFGFGRRLGWKRYVAVNAFGLISTDVKGLAVAADPYGPDYDESIKAVLAEADIIVACWGNRTKLPKSLRPRLDEMARRLHGCGKPVLCWGLTSSGDPIHPMMLGYDTPLIALPAPGESMSCVGSVKPMEGC